MYQGDIDNRHQQLLNDVVDVLKNEGILKYTSAVIAAGSFGRGEPTYHVKEDGTIEYGSDIEMALVYSSISDMLNIKKHAHKIIGQFPQVELELMPISEGRLKKGRNHNYSLISKKEKTLFTYDFYNGSQTLYGENLLKEKIQSSQIDPFEGKRIIGNRVAELIYKKNCGADRKEIERWIAKTIIAIGTALLIETKAYDSSYTLQRENINRNSSYVKGLLGATFLEDYEWAFQFLRKGNYVKFGHSESIVKQYVRIMCNYYDEIKINKSKTNCLYISIREFLLLVKYDFKLWRNGLNPKNLILNSVMHSYCEDLPESTSWANAWKRVLN